jgi:hypothetical protein
VDLAEETDVGLPRTNLVKNERAALEVATTFPDLSPPGPIEVTTMPLATSELTGPTPQSLLERAAALPPRRSWESIVTTASDPVLDAKLEPRVAERRARFRRFVKGTLSGCVGLCIVALAVTALSGGETPAASAATTAPSVATKATTPVERMGGVTRGKASAQTAAAPVDARVALSKRPLPAGKRR